MTESFSCFPRITEKNLVMILKNAEEDDIQRVIKDICADMIEESVLGLCFEVHRSVKLGTFFLEDMKDDSKKYEIVKESGLDVFGQVPMKKQFECVCPNCQRNLAASRFAPHLEKCLGMGRNSSRLASRRIANSGGNKESDNEDDHDNDNDNDWNYHTERKASKRKRERRNSPRPTKAKLKNSDSGSVGSNSSSDSTSLYANYEIMSTSEKKALLMQMCGVISEHTKKMCTKSQKCPQHTDEQRKNVRAFLLRDQNLSEGISEDIQIDIDTYDDSENQTLRESLNRLWECNSNEGSTAGESVTSSNDSWSVSTKNKKDKLRKTQHLSLKNKKLKKTHPNSSHNSLDSSPI